MKYRIAAALLSLAWAGCAPAEENWIAAWASAQQIPEPQNSLPDDSLRDATLRQIIHPALAGTHFRLRLSNAFGTAPLVIDAVSAARSVDPASARIAAPVAVSFSGRPSVTIPAGADYLSDEISLDLPAGASLAVSLHLPQPPARQTGHPGSRATSYVLAGNHVADADLAGARPVEHWYLLTGLEVRAPAGTAIVAAFGDSITDGHGATVNGDDRWTDDLARRGAVTLNLGIGGNHLLTDGLGPNALSRFDRDVLARPGVRSVIVLEGINDLGNLARDHAMPPEDHADLVGRMIAAYGQLIERAHDRGLRIVGGTLLPFVGSDYYHPDAATEADRRAINTWIRAPGHFDAVIDFDQITRDPKDSSKLRADYDCGDHLHPSPAGYQAMADAIPLTLVLP